MSELNRIHNASNPNQGNTERVLAICSAGLLRSPTIATVMAQRGYNARAVGCEAGHALIPLEQVHVAWADTILTVDGVSTAALRHYEIDEGTAVYQLNLPDMYPWMDPELVRLVEDRLDRLAEFEVHFI